MLKDRFKFNIHGKSVPPNATVGQALALMQRNKTNCLLVKADGDRAVGILSEHDIVTAFAYLDHAAKKAKVSDFMSLDIIASLETDTLDDALKTMAEHNVGHLPVLNEYGNVLDFLSIMDIVLCKAREGNAA